MTARTRRRRAPALCAVLVPALLAAGLAALHAGAGEPPPLPEPAADALPPPVVPGEPGGAFGYSRYVFSEIDGKVVTTLVEGPRGEQVRCQEESLPCSYLDLKALHESGGPIPEALEISREELGTLVSQLDTLRDTLARYDSIHRACADGYHPVSEQNPNMGIHMAKFRHMDGVFDPAEPEMLLFAMEGGEKLSKQEIGDCVDGRFTGDERMRVVGAAFILPTQAVGDDHPEGFAGPFDNWHVHYHSCVGTRSDTILTKAQCAARGGELVEKSGWMIHAYAEPDFDSQTGVFSMWNPSIWPVRERRDRAAAAGEAGPEIRNFEFPPLTAATGEAVTITNGDAIPHTVTAGAYGEPSGRFESGTLASGESYTFEVDEPGEYRFFCTIHPFMTGRLVVE